MSILLLTKNTDWCVHAQNFLSTIAPETVVCAGNLGDPLPELASSWRGEYVVSFLSPWIIPAAILSNASKAAINFHPGPPEYPGIGCYNFALYDGVDRYGVTCHHMLAKVDTGSVIAASRFDLYPHDTVATLKDRSMNALLGLYYDICARIVRKEPLPTSEESWTRRPYTRSELNELGRITFSMTEDEIRRRYRAMNFPPYPGLYLELAGITFKA